jgi:uncharacterized protein YdbL (DUF1318 family)
MMKVMNVPMSLLLLLLVTACVTINVYFPAEAAVKAADRIILDVYGKAPDGKDEEKPAAREPTSRLQDAARPVPVAVHLLNWLVAPALAEANLSINTPAISQLQAKMEQRHRQLAPYYASGAIGMTGDGRITLRDQKLVPLKDRNEVKGLVSQENLDRDALYAEIARANGHPEWEGEIRQTFARRWVANARAGWYYMDGGNWKQK